MKYIIDKNRIYLKNNAKNIVAEICFEELEDKVYNIYHTYVDENYRGQGIATKLMEYALEEIDRRGGKVSATCSYAINYLKKEKDNGKKDSR